MSITALRLTAQGGTTRIMRTVLILTVSLWAVAFFGSFVAFYLVPADDFGFTAGANKALAFTAGQAIAFVLTVMSLFMRWSTEDTTLRRWAAVPALGTGLLIVAFAGLFFWAQA